MKRSREFTDFSNEPSWGQVFGFRRKPWEYLQTEQSSPLPCVSLGWRWNLVFYNDKIVLNFTFIGAKQSNSSARQGWIVDWAPTGLQNGPTNGGVVTTPLPIKLLPLASPGLKLEGKVWRADALALSNRTVCKPINAATPGWELRCANYSWKITTVLPLGSFDKTRSRREGRGAGVNLPSEKSLDITDKEMVG